MCCRSLPFRLFCVSSVMVAYMMKFCILHMSFAVYTPLHSVGTVLSILYSYKVHTVWCTTTDDTDV